ncbi:Crp/Fnr family transcriptional regulator [Methylobacterium durans]|uniref:Crp/Fnr family transcriptional regulator n=1 Tax=Methylobacterium durans TaxID=2202825 RepID=UPI002AFE44ED|nr:Crp/Fnr family transcriptional regulator [Methylobacterium durans]MEA1832178.1 Crp/Fnr family transcriptional regulator [Methylobacterium durans]
MSSTLDHSLSMLVRKLASIGPLSESEQHAVLNLPAVVRSLPARHEILREGDVPSQCCLVLDGWVSRYKQLKDGRRQIFSFHVPGDMPDLQSLHVPVMDHGLCTLTQASLAFIPHQSLRKLTVRFPGLAAALWRETLIDGGIFRAWMLGLGHRSAFEHMAHLFCELYLKLEAVGLAQDYRYSFPIMQTDLGDALGLTNVHANRTLQVLRRKELITLQRGSLVINDWPALVRAAGFDPAYLSLEDPQSRGWNPQ